MPLQFNSTNNSCSTSSQLSPKFPKNISLSLHPYSNLRLMQNQKATRWWGKRQIIMDFQYVVRNTIRNIYKTKNLSLNHVDSTTYKMEGKSAVRECMFKRYSYSYHGNGCILVNQTNLMFTAGYPTHTSVHFLNPGRHFCSFLSIIYFYHQLVNIPIIGNKIGRCTEGYECSASLDILQKNEISWYSKWI